MTRKYKYLILLDLYKINKQGFYIGKPEVLA